MPKLFPRLRPLDIIETAGNRLPDPVTLFILGTILVMILSHLGATWHWQVTERLPQHVASEADDAATPTLQWQPVPETRDEFITRVITDEQGNPLIDPHTGQIQSEVVRDPHTGEPLTRTITLDQPKIHRVQSLLTADGLFWALRSMVNNFVTFPPLGVVLVGMLGIGIAERTGLIEAALKAFMLIVPGTLLTPCMVFIGIISSLTVDAGYVVLPPLAAALYQAVGRAPLAGIAAVFAGVSAGFNANLFLTGLDPMLAEFSTIGATVIQPDYVVNPACNWAFMIVSTIIITFTGWFVTARYVERRLNRKPSDEGGPDPDTRTPEHARRLTPSQKQGLQWSAAVMLLTLALFIMLALVPGMPLHGQGLRFDRWVEVIVPALFFIFVIPGIVYGLIVKSIRSDRDIARLLTETMAAMAPIIVLAFVAAQFIAHFQYSGLDRVLAMVGGQWLGQQHASPSMLIVAFILVTLTFNLFMGSMSAKYALFAPIFVPMFMLAGISPELTQAAYRVGDSVSNIITPLNAYLVIVLVFMQKYVPKGGMGTLIATMFPYTIAFTIVWTAMLLIWMAFDLPLGIDGPLRYNPAALP